jgi:hypothetical protein
LAISLWSEVLAIPDARLRSELIERVSQRMGRAVHEMLPEGTLDDRIRSLANVMLARRIPASFERDGSIPVLAMHACPYPDLVQRDQDRSLCRLEQQVLSQAIGQQMELSQCKLDGHGCCQFKPAEKLVSAQ